MKFNPVRPGTEHALERNLCDLGVRGMEGRLRRCDLGREAVFGVWFVGWDSSGSRACALQPTLRSRVPQALEDAHPLGVPDTVLWGHFPKLVPSLGVSVSCRAFCS